MSAKGQKRTSPCSFGDLVSGTKQPARKCDAWRFRGFEIYCSVRCSTRQIAGTRKASLNSTSRVRPWNFALVFVSIRCRLFFGSPGRVEHLQRSSDLRGGPAVRFRNILNFECQAHQSKMLWLMWPRRKPGEREAAIRRAWSWNSPSLCLRDFSRSVPSRQMFSVVLQERGSANRAESRQVFACLGPTLGPTKVGANVISLGQLQGGLIVHECAAVGCANTRPPLEAKRHWEATGSQRYVCSRLRTSPVTAVRTAADVHPAPIRPPLDTIIVAVAAVVRPRGGQCDTGSYAPPRPPAATAPANPSAACPPATCPGATACPSPSTGPDPARSCDSHSPRANDSHSSRPSEAHSSTASEAHTGASKISSAKTWTGETAHSGAAKSTHSGTAGKSAGARFDRG
jgi:hypothetical protein